MNQIASPSLRWLFIDEHEDGIRGGGFEFTANQFEKAYWMDIPASRHAGSGTISFADGHVESRKWLSPKTYVPVLHVRQFAIWMDGDKRDIEWLWLRTTTPITVPVFQ